MIIIYDDRMMISYDDWGRDQDMRLGRDQDMILGRDQDMGRGRDQDMGPGETWDWDPKLWRQYPFDDTSHEISDLQVCILPYRDEHLLAVSCVDEKHVLAQQAAGWLMDGCKQLQPPSAHARLMYRISWRSRQQECGDIYHWQVHRGCFACLA